MIANHIFSPDLSTAQVPKLIWKKNDPSIFVAVPFEAFYAKHHIPLYNNKKICILSRNRIFFIYNLRFQVQIYIFLFFRILFFSKFHRIALCIFNLQKIIGSKAYDRFPFVTMTREKTVTINLEKYRKYITKILITWD